MSDGNIRCRSTASLTITEILQSRLLLVTNSLTSTLGLDFKQQQQYDFIRGINKSQQNLIPNSSSKSHSNIRQCSKE